MKKISTLFLFFLSFFFLKNIQAQCNPDASEFLWVNEVGAEILGGGDLFWDQSSTGKFVVPYVPGEIETSTVFASALWLGGFDSGGVLKTACQTYGGGGVDFWAGPIDENTGEVFPDGCTDFDRIWSVTRGDVMQVIEDFADNGAIDSPLPANIMAWPARGNSDFETLCGFPLPDQELAPFFDQNDDGIYEPMNGDYPVLDTDWPNVIPDKMTWCVYNDIEGVHQETLGAPLGVEVHQLAYAFNSIGDAILNRTIFTRHIIHKKAESNLDEFRMAWWMDYNVGCFDYVGCDTSLNTQYGYNIEIDNPNCNLVSIYDGNTPVQTATFLNHEMTAFTYHNNPSQGGPPAGTISPQVDGEFYHYMSGSWRTGTPFTHGGLGGDSNGTPTPFAFPDPPSNPAGWSLFTASDATTNFDRHAVQSAGPYPLPNGEKIILDMAHTYHRQQDADFLENVDFALGNVAELKALFDEGFNDGEVGQLVFCDDADCKWPGDATSDGIAKEDDLLFLGVAMGMGATGPAAVPQSVVWTGYETEDWGQTFFNGRNFKHADFNGDGVPNEIDEEVLRLNFGLTVSDYVPVDDTPAPFAEGEVFVEWSKDEVSSTDNDIQRLIQATVVLGSETAPFSEPLCGIAMTIAYDTDVLEPSFLDLIQLSSNLFLGDDEEIIHVLHTDTLAGRLSVGIARKDGVSIDPAYGNIVRLGFRFREDATTTNPLGTDSISVEILNLVGVNETIGFFTLGAASDTFVGTDMEVVSGAAERFSDEVSLSIQPNPNHGTFIMFSENMDSPLALSVFDLQGRKIWDGTMPAGQNNFTISLKDGMRSGIYLLKGVREDGLFTSRKIVVK